MEEDVDYTIILILAYLLFVWVFYRISNNLIMSIGINTFTFLLSWIIYKLWNL